jgi:hypothetical protein
MGQNRKVGKSRHKNKLETVKTDDLFEITVAAPLEKVEPKPPMFPNYDFYLEVKKDAANERRLFFAEFIILGGIALLVVIRILLLSKF